METKLGRKNKIKEDVLIGLGAQDIGNGIYRVNQKHFRLYHNYDMKDKPDKYSLSFYFGIKRNVLENIQRYQDPHILIICDHKKTDLYGEDAVDLLIIPVGVFSDNLEVDRAKPSSTEKGDLEWNMNIRVTKDGRYLLDIPGKDNIPLYRYLNKFINLGITNEIELKDFERKIEKPQSDGTYKETVEPEYDSWSEASCRSGAVAPPIEESETENDRNSDGICHSSPGRSDKRIGFMSYVEKGTDFIGGCLLTDEELMPVEFIVTDYVKPATKLQKILHGAQFDMKWFGDLIAGTLFEGVKKTESSDGNKIKAIFVADDRMLHLRRKTGDTPVAFIGDKDKIIAHNHYLRDEERISPILEKVKKNSDVSEVLSRVNEGIKEKISSGSEGGQ